EFDKGESQTPLKINMPFVNRRRRFKNTFENKPVVFKANVSEHIKHIFEEGELTKETTVRKFRTVQKEGKRNVESEIEHYNLDMIISLGCRIKSSTATQFRIWA